MSSPFIESQCFICGTVVSTLQRYPHIACDACRDRAVNAAGERLRFYNTHIGGGFEARRVADDTVDDDVTRTNVIYIDGVACYANEARFGGSVVQPLNAHPDRPEG